MSQPIEEQLKAVARVLDGDAPTVTATEGRERVSRSGGLDPLPLVATDNPNPLAVRVRRAVLVGVAAAAAILALVVLLPQDDDRSLDVVDQTDEEDDEPPVLEPLPPPDPTGVVQPEGVAVTDWACSHRVALTTGGETLDPESIEEINALRVAARATEDQALIDASDEIYRAVKDIPRPPAPALMLDETRHYVLVGLDPVGLRAGEFALGARCLALGSGGPAVMPSEQDPRPITGFDQELLGSGDALVGDLNVTWTRYRVTAPDGEDTLECLVVDGDAGYLVCDPPRTELLLWPADSEGIFGREPSYVRRDSPRGMTAVAGLAAPEVAGVEMQVLPGNAGARGEPVEIEGTDDRLYVIVMPIPPDARPDSLVSVWAVGADGEPLE